MVDLTLTEQISINEILLEASAFGLRNEVDMLAIEYIEIGVFPTRAYQLAYGDLTEDY